MSTYRHPWRWDPFVPQHFLVVIQLFVASTGMFAVAKHVGIGHCFGMADWALPPWVYQLLFLLPIRLLCYKRLLWPLLHAIVDQR